MTKKNYLYGKHAVEALIAKNPERILCLYLQKNSAANWQKIAVDLNISVELLPKDRLDQLTDGANHQGVVACYRQAPTLTEKDLPDLLKKLDKKAFILILDSVQDPHNLGACFRTAEAAGVQLIIAPRDKSVGLTATVSKVASGAAELVPFVQVINLARTLALLKEAGVWVYGAAMDGSENYFSVDFTGPTALVLGSEGKGLRHLTRESCDYLINIPMQGEISSLNVSVAAGILMYEVLRQRTLEKK